LEEGRKGRDGRDREDSKGRRGVGKVKGEEGREGKGGGKGGREGMGPTYWVKFTPLSASWIECATVWDLVSRLTPRTYVNANIQFIFCIGLRWITPVT